MPANINGIVFHDTNHNGQYSPDKPGIPGVTIVLFQQDAGCLETVTEASGSYQFTISTPGVYSVYETVASGEPTCPPSIFTQPAGYTLSNGPRKQTITITRDQIDANATISGVHFSHDTFRNPFTCEPEMIVLSGNPTKFYLVSPVSGSYEDQGTLIPADNVNAIGYQVQDNYVYGYDQTVNTIVRINSDRTLSMLYPRPTGLPAAAYSVGTLDQRGFYYLYVSGTNRFYTVDLRENSPTFLKLVDPGRGFEEQTGNYGTPLMTPISIGDWVFSPMDEYLYGVDRNGVVQRISPIDGAVTPLATTGPNPGSLFGALAQDASGAIYAISDSDGTLYRYTISGDTANGVRFGSTVFSDSSDATMCPYQLIELDYGDAPDAGGGGGSGNYNTLLGNNGPRHGLISPLYLGYQVTPDEDARQNATATGDDLPAGIQDDGITGELPPLSLNASSYEMQVFVTNHTSSPAWLYAWIDYNKNGLFEASEAVAPVPIQPNTAEFHTLVSTVPPNLVLSPGHTFVRLRLTTDLLTDTGTEIQDTRSVGPAKDGEVEDYILNIGTNTDLSILKTADVVVLQTGDTITYTILVENTGPEDALNTVVTDAVPVELTNPQFSLDNGATWDHWSGALALGTLAAGQSVTVLLRGFFDGSTLGPVVNTAQVTTTSEDPNPGNNQSTVTTPVNRAANLSVEKTADRQIATAGESLTYTIRIQNAGPDTAEDTTLIDAIPVELENPIYSIDNGQTWMTWPGQLSLGDLPVNADQTVLIYGMVAAGATGILSNTAEVVSVTDDPEPGDNQSTIDLPVEASADLSITKSGAPNPVGIGDKVVYTIVVTNSGPADAQDVALTDIPPDALSDLEYSSDGGATWAAWSAPFEVGPLNSGQTILLLLRATVTAQTPRPIYNTITVTSSTPDPDPNNNSYTAEVEAVSSADLAVIKTADLPNVISGERLIYTITITNHGPSEATNVQLTDDVPAGLTNPEFSLDSGTTWNPWLSPHQIGTLANGETAVVLIRGTVTVDQDEILINTAVASGDEMDPVPENNADTTTTSATASADLTVLKTASAQEVAGGEALTYTVMVTNNGPSPARDVEVTDTVPAGLTGVEYSTDLGVTWNPWTGSATVGIMLTNEEITILIRGIVSASATGTLVNTVSINSATPDPDPGNNQSTVITPVIASTHLAIKKISSTHPVVAGERILYTIVLSNAGFSNAQNVTITDDIPSSISNVQYSTDYGITWNPWVSPLLVGDLPAGGVLEFLLRGDVSPSAQGEIINTVMVDSTTPDPDPSDNQSTDITTVETSADLTIIKLAAPDPAVVGAPLTYTITVTNSGPSDAQGVLISDTVPAELETVQFSSDGGATWEPWGGSYLTGVLPAGSTLEILIRGDVAATASGTLSNTAIVTSVTPDPNPGDNSITILTPVETSADLSVTKTGTPNPAVPGQFLTYTLTVTNAGPDDGEDVILADDITDQLTGVEYSTDNGATWNPWNATYRIGTLPSGNSVSVLIRGLLRADAAGLLSNTASVTSATPDPNPDNNQVTELTPIGVSADVRVTKQAAPSPVTPGERLVYTIFISNNGPNLAENVVLTDTVPAAIQNPEYSTDNGVTWLPWTGTYLAGSLAANGQLQVQIRGTVAPDTAETILNTALISSSTPDPVPDDNGSTAETEVTPSADISITKTSSPRPAIPGQPVRYTITVRNDGPSDASAVTVFDAVPTALENPEFSTDNGASWTVWPGSHSIASLTAGTAITLLIQGRVSLSATGQLTNTAVVSSETPDPDPSNNTATDTNSVADSADVSIVKQAQPNPAVSGQLLTYVLTAANAGPAEAQNVVISDTLPAEFTGAEFSLNNGTTWTPWAGSVTLGTLAEGATEIVLLRGTLAGNAGESIRNTAAITSSTDDPNPDNNSSTIVTDLLQPADLSVRKTVSPSTAVQGGLLTYTVTVKNNGPAASETVTLSDTAVLRALSNVQYSTDNGASWNSFLGRVDLGTLANQAERTILVQGTVHETATDVVVNAATVDSATPDPNPDNNTASITTPVRASADLSITKSAQPAPAVPGQLITYTITVQNSGPSPAQEVMLIDSISRRLSGVEFSVDSGATWNPWTSPYAIGTIPSDAAITILIRGTLQAAASGQLTNTATVTSATPDPDPDNNQVTIVTPIQNMADLSIQKLPHPNPAIPGQSLTYTILINNAGPAEARNVVLSDVIQGATFSLDGGVTWRAWNGSYQLDLIQSHTVVSVLLRVIVPTDATGVFTNTADVTSSTPDPNPDNNTVTVNTPIANTADLSLRKTGTPNVVASGDDLTYTITIDNLGSMDAENVQLKDLAPSSLSDVQFSTDGGNTWNPWMSPLTLGTVEDGGTRTILIRGTVTAASGDIRNTAAVSSTTPDPDYTNNADQVVTQISTGREANLSVVKKAVTTPVAPGQSVTYLISLQNSGPAAAENVLLYDAPDPELSNVVVSLDDGATWIDWQNPYQLGTVAAGSTVQILLRGQVAALASGTVSNTVVATSTTLDPDPTDNIDTEIVPLQNQADLSILKTADRTWVHPCESILYSLSAHNAGPSAAENVVIYDPVEHAEYSVDGGVTWYDWIGSYTVGTMSNGHTFHIFIRTLADHREIGAMTNTATISASTPDPNPDNNTSSVTIRVERLADLKISKVSCLSEISPCQQLLYQITVSNSGPDTAMDVVITDMAPNCLCDVCYAYDGEWTWRPWPGQLNVGNIPNGSHISIQIAGVVDRYARGTIVNQASVSSATPDPCPDNNTDTATTWIQTDCCWTNPLR